jgi:two-component system cell cycle response regulator DivK
MNETALIIEDDEDLANIFAEALRGVGFDVQHAADGRIAKKTIKEKSAPYLVLLDMHLPHISGADLLIEMKDDDRFADTIIIITTADARMGEAYGDQVDFVLVKPISFVQLRDLCARLKPQD